MIIIPTLIIFVTDLDHLDMKREQKTSELVFFHQNIQSLLETSMYVAQCVFNIVNEMINIYISA